MLLQMALFSSMAEECSIVYMHHISFIHPSVDGLLACFHVLGIMNCATVNLGVRLFFELQVCSDICPGMGLLDHMVILFLAL